MGRRRSGVISLSLKILLGFTLVYAIQNSAGFTNPNDVAAINSLYAALGSPALPGWVAIGGDPCGEGWQGVDCDATRTFIISIKLVGANLGGKLGDNLGAFSSIKDITLSNNHIGGSIPTNIPSSLVSLFLSDNKLTGTIPSSLASLHNLSAISLNKNELTGEIPDAFEGMKVLVNLDLSSNNLSGQLPPSMRNLSSLITFHLQNNKLSGTLDVLLGPPIKNLDVRNNLFSGPIPAKLLSIPNFRKDGNPFNTSTTPFPPQTSSAPPPKPPPFLPGPASNKTSPASGRSPGKQADGPSSVDGSNPESTKKSSRRKRVVWISIASVFSAIILLLGAILFMPRCLRKRREAYTSAARETTRDTSSAVLPTGDHEKASPLVVERPSVKNQQRALSLNLDTRNGAQANQMETRGAPRKKYDGTELSRFDMDLMLPPPPPPPPPPRPTPPPLPEATEEKSFPIHLASTSVKAYTIASLQQFTNSFSQENLVGSGILGNVYRADHPDGRLLAIKKLDKRVSEQQKDYQFIELVNSIDKIRHPNVVQLMGYCSEHGQRLLIYEYCTNGSLQDALHSVDDIKKNLSWNTRMRMALEAARSLEYLHEVCEPPIVHRNFRSASVLLDDELSVHVSGCGLSSLVLSGALSQLSGQLLTTYGYGAPEFESRVFTSKSDVYSFGVVMLELLTGRMSYDRTKTRGEQFLARWAVSQLHDIDALTRMVDPALSGRYSVKSLSRFADIISRCIQVEPEFRASMCEVVQDLVQMIHKDSSCASLDRD